MIRKPNNWESVKEFTDRKKLPLGAYVCKVKGVRIDSFDGTSAQLCIQFDIAEGEYIDFYKREYAANTMANKKFKGVLRVWLPKDDGSENDEWTKSTFKGMCTAFEKSNPGYVWNWNEQTLVGRMVGILFRNEEWEYDGKTGWAVRPFRAISVDSVRSGDLKIPKEKTLKKNNSGGYGDSYSGNYGGGYGEAYDSFATNNGGSGGFAVLDDDDAQLLF
jgi:hypothetical protein